MNLSPLAAAIIGGALLLPAACSDRDPPPREPPTPGPARSAPSDMSSDAVNAAAWTPPPQDAETATPAMARAQIWLARAGFSPGVIDGRYGENVRQAVAAFQREQGLTVSGELDQRTWSRLQQADGPPAIVRHVLTEADVSGPFTRRIPESLQGQAQLERLGYTDAAEKIAERFHMDVDFLRSLNPDVDLTRAGAEIMVANPARPTLREVARIEVDKAEKAVRAYGADGTLVAFFPATIGSEEQPSPSGSMTVEGVAHDPTYTYDPERVSYAGDAIQRRLVVAPGPNNPVGTVWIDLSRPSYGIHGTPDPALIGKTASNGCVRLTNWDAEALAEAVEPGVEVVFV